MDITYCRFPADATDQVAFANHGEWLSCLLNGGRKVIGSMRGSTGDVHQALEVNATTDYGFSCVGMREIFVDKGIWDIEVLFANIADNAIARLSRKGKETPLRLSIDASNLSVLRTSYDGRYLGCGNGDGQLELWHMDMGPHRYFCHNLREAPSIADMSFMRNNLEVLLASSNGMLFHIEPGKDSVNALHDDDQLWPCYSIDCQHDSGHGIVFGGEGDTLWFLNLEHRLKDEAVNMSQHPFGLSRGRTVTGGTYHYVTGMPGASVSGLRTNVGSYIKQVRFIGDDLVCAMGTKATEVWKISGEKPSLVGRRQHNRDSRLLGLAAQADLILVGVA